MGLISAKSVHCRQLGMRLIHKRSTSATIPTITTITIIGTTRAIAATAMATTHGMAVRLAGPFKAASVSHIVLIHGTGTDPVRDRGPPAGGLLFLGQSRSPAAMYPRVSAYFREAREPLN